MWVYKSSIGVLYIKKSGGRYGIWYNNCCYGNYHSAVAAADDVCTFSTGCAEWDLLCGSVEPPMDLSEWERC